MVEVLLIHLLLSSQAIDGRHEVDLALEELLITKFVGALSGTHGVAHIVLLHHSILGDVGILFLP